MTQHVEVPSTSHNPSGLAATARSVLGCPGTVSIVVEGHRLDEHDDLDTVAVRDLAGTPTFSVPPTSSLVTAGANGQRALLRVESGLGPSGGPDRALRLDVAGRLEERGSEDCPCCFDERRVVVLVPSVVLLSHDGTRSTVPLADFTSPAHELNRGYLQRAVEHANARHQDDLRAAVAQASSCPLSRIAAVRLADLTPSGVEVRWVDPDGGRSLPLRFPRAARTAAELGELLRRQLHAGLC